jgi:hypothetical protein
MITDHWLSFIDFENFWIKKIEYNMDKVKDSLQYHSSISNRWVLVIYSHVTASFNWERRFGAIKVANIPPRFIKCLYQDKKVSGHVYVYLFCFCFHDISIEFWNWSDNVVLKMNVEMKYQCWRCRLLRCRRKFTAWRLQSDFSNVTSQNSRWYMNLNKNKESKNTIS